MLERLGRGAARHHWVVIAVWIVIAVGLGAFAGKSDGKTRDAIHGPNNATATNPLATGIPKRGRHAAQDAMADVGSAAPARRS